MENHEIFRFLEFANANETQLEVFGSWVKSEYNSLFPGNEELATYMNFLELAYKCVSDRLEIRGVNLLPLNEH